MELSEAISVRRFLEFTQAQKEELCSTLLELAEHIEGIPMRSIRKTLEITLAALKYKCETAANAESDKGLERALSENDKLKQMVDKLEQENKNYKHKIKSLTDEIFQTQQRLKQATQATEMSDKDSSDPLSELDKQEDLLRNINLKNKHIRRQIHDIEILQNQNIDLSRSLLALDNEVTQLKRELENAAQQQSSWQQEVASMKEQNNALKVEIARLESNVTYLEEEREKSQTELQEFMSKFEQKTHSWRQQLEVKELELQQLRTHTGSASLLYNTADKDATEVTTQIENDYNQLVGAIEKRDGIIANLHAKIKSMAAEMLSSTAVMNKLNNEQEALNKRRLANACCKLTEQSLQAATERSRELSEMLTRSEDENRLQAQRFQQALSTLEAYQRGEDGLAKVLRKCSALERKLMARDKQIRALVQEANDMQEVAQQNKVLRKRLGLSEEDVVTTKHLLAKERSKEKIIEQLTLKLRASEELRLQLQLDMTQLRQELLVQRKQPVAALEKATRKKARQEISEIGEVEDSSQVDTEKQLLPMKPTVEALDTKHKYHELLMENETLRNGMHEILENLQNYNENSKYINIDKQLLRSLIAALQPKTEVKMAATNLLAIDDSSSSIQDVRAAEVTQKSEVTLVTSECGAIDSSTRPTTPCLDMNESIVLPVIDEPAAQVLDYKAQYEQLKLQLSNSDCETQAYCAQLIEEAANKDLELRKQKSSYNYLQQELNNALSSLKEKELQHIKSLAAVRQTLNEQQARHAQLEAAFETYKQEYQHHNDEFSEMEKSQQTNQAQLAKIIDMVLAGELNEQLRITDLCVDYGVIEHDLQVKYVTAQEYAEQQENYRKAKDKYDELKRQLSQVEDLLQIAQDQIKSQQKLINELTDNHINLRHLVADLQSENEQKFLLARMQRELDAAKKEILLLKGKRDKVHDKCALLERDLQAEKQQQKQTNQQITQERQATTLKIRFLEKSLLILKDKYAKFTPLVFLSNFVYAHTKFIKSASMQQTDAKETTTNLNAIIEAYLKDNKSETIHAPNYIKFVRLESHCEYLEENIKSYKQRCQNLELELNELRMRYAKENEHWRTLNVLFGKEITLINIAVQTSSEINYVDRALSPVVVTPTTTTPTKEFRNKDAHTNEQSTQTSAVIEQLTANHIKENVTQTKKIQVENQCVQTASATETATNDLLNEVNKKQNLLIMQEQDLKAANLRIEELLKEMSEIKSELEKEKEKEKCHIEPNIKGNPTDIIEKTIMSFHKLLSEKDLSIGKYQELLQNQRDQTQASSAKLELELESLKNTMSNLNFNIKTKDVEILELQQQLQMLKSELNERHNLTKLSAAEMSNENSLNEMTDEKLEEMFEEQDMTKQQQQQLSADTNTHTHEIIEKQDNEKLKEEPALLKRLKELKDKIIYVEQTHQVKDEEINLLREKLCFYQEREKQEQHNVSQEIEQLRIILEEKDKHINDLMQTVRSFHDDQERFLNDATNYSADQLAKIAADLKRSEATNQIYQTQLEAMRRQMNSMSQREKQTRELNVTLRNELIKRPVVSIKTELNARVKNENLQKRIQQLESELDECRAQLQRQQAIIDVKRVKSANEVSLWEKQKRWQQTAEKLKVKLDEVELTLEKTRTLLQSARSTIARLEKEKHVLETKVNKMLHNNLPNMKCCRTPSCPNLQQNSAKYTPSETPETYTGVSSESSSPANGSTTARAVHETQAGAGNAEYLVEALKARIELQQRKLLSLEVEGKGNSVLSAELEQLQQRLSNVEAQNMRLEAQNLQLQLDNDVCRQGDANERLQQRIKHLEDYIITLKEEMAAKEIQREPTHAEARNSTNETIQSLRVLVEKLRAENKLLKDGKRSPMTTPNTQLTQLKNVQKKYNEAVEKIAQLNAELKTKKCDCNARKTATTTTTTTTTKQACDELKFIKEQLLKKTQLLQKAKVLLTRAAAKEKVLKEQVSLWKRKCSELQNVPVIEEISE